MKIMILRTKADRQRYCDLQLARIFGSSSTQFERNVNRATLEVIVCLLIVFALWCFFAPTAQAAELDCYHEANTLEVVAKLRDSGAPRQKAYAVKESSRLWDNTMIDFVYRADATTPHEFWRWGHGYCTAVTDMHLFAAPAIARPAPVTARRG